MKGIFTSALFTLAAFLSRQLPAQSEAGKSEKNNEKKMTNSENIDIRQNGKNNTAEVSQNADSTGRVTIIKDINGNIQTIRTDGSDANQRLKIEQNGHHNKAIVNQSGGSGNSVRVRQTSPSENK